MTTKKQAIADLDTRIAAAVTPLADCAPGYALLDFPDYSNVGDSLIWLGELAFFDRHAEHRPGYVSTIHGFDPAALQQAVPDGPIYLSGGGNFGDLWPRFQAFRLRVLAAFPGRRIVQLPQTIHFGDERALAETRAAIAAHGNFTMLVRDATSLATARDALRCEATLCPDMAFCMGLQAAPEATHDVVALLRTDKERALTGDVAVPAELDCVLNDWIRRAAPRRLDRVRGRIERWLHPTSDYDRFAAIAQAERARGVALLAQGRTIVTDRLHGHILGILIDRPQLFIDNSYGKLSGFAAAWTGDMDGVRSAASPEAAFAELVA